MGRSSGSRRPRRASQVVPLPPIAEHDRNIAQTSMETYSLPYWPGHHVHESALNLLNGLDSFLKEPVPDMLAAIRARNLDPVQEHWAINENCHLAEQMIQTLSMGREYAMQLGMTQLAALYANKRVIYQEAYARLQGVIQGRNVRGSKFARVMNQIAGPMPSDVMDIVQEIPYAASDSNKRNHSTQRSKKSSKGKGN